MDMIIEPAVPSGTVKAPPSKSMAHRLLICAGLAGGQSTVRGIAPSQDILATADCLEALGACVERDIPDGDDITDKGGQNEEEAGRAGSRPEQVWRITGTDPAGAGSAALRCRESGSTLRFFIPLCALSEDIKTLTGSRKLLERPLDVYSGLFRRSGIRLGISASEIRAGGRLRPGVFRMDGSVSSQFISGMLFALPLLDGDSIIELVPPVESRGYIDMTISALASFGVRVSWEDEFSIRIPGGQSYEHRDITVEGDWSNAAFFIAMGLPVTGLDEGSLQPDRVCTEYFRMLDKGAAVLDISGCPDLGPVLMAYAALRDGCTLTGTRRLRIKESDRGEAMREELAKFGIRADVRGNSIRVEGGSGGRLRRPSEILDGHNDHRIVMSLAVMCTRTGGTIRGAEAVNKSFPDFASRLESAGCRIRI